MAGRGNSSTYNKSFNPYVDKLAEYGEFAFANEAAFIHKGKWAEFFNKRASTESLSKTGMATAFSRRCILEIGCSSGAFLNRIASAQPGHFFIGMDWKYKLVYKACEKASELSLKNTAFLRSKAQDLGRIFGAQELDEIWYFFPDPWPKGAQHKHRVFQEPFLVDALKVLKPGGILHVKTDHPGYYQWMLAVLGIQWQGPQVSTETEFTTDSLGGHYSRRGRQMEHRSFANKELPPASKVAENFDLVYRTDHFWNHRDARAAIFGDELPFWWNETTLFEALFLRDNLPVYAFSLRKRV